MAKPVIEVENLSKEYVIGKNNALDLRSYFTNLFSTTNNNQKILALDNVNFKVEQGEILGLIGPNGSGKSTLLKILSKITYPTSGTARIRGKVSSLLEVGTGFHPELTGRENIYLNGSLLGMQRNEIKQKFDEIVDFSGIEKFIDTPVKHYSSGMYMRLAFSIAAHLQPEILLVDEVLSVGDLEFREKSLNKMDEVAKSGKTVLFVSHNLGVIKNLCNRGLLISSGNGKYYSEVNTMIGDYSEGIINIEKFCHTKNSILSNVSMHILDGQDKESKIAEAGDFLKIQFGFESEYPFDNLDLRIDICNAEGIRILVLRNLFTGDIIPIKKGKNSIVCTIDKLNLNTGKYYLHLIIKNKKDVLLHIQNINSFIVYEGGFYKSGKMPAKDIHTLIDHQWITEM